jgi:hypothetical protein
MGRKVRICAITLILLAFFSVPLAFIAYGMLGGLLGGILFLAPFIAVQCILLKLIERWLASRESKPQNKR